MATLLRIDASAQQQDRSLTRMLTTLFTTEFLHANPDAKVIVRDIGQDPIPAIDHRFVHAAFTPPEAREDWMTNRLALSDALIDEVVAADIIVMGAPMYNYGMPAALKGWIDHIARIGRTFSFDLARGDSPIEPILKGKHLVVLSSRGEFGFEPGGPRAHMNALDPAIAACAHYFGVDAAHIQTVAIEYQEFKDARHDRSVTAAKEATRALAQQFGKSAKQTIFHQTDYPEKRKDQTMKDFPTHTMESAPADAKPILQAALKGYGFVPNLYAAMAEAPAILEGYTTLSAIFGKTDLSETERQIILMTNNRLNGCKYCMAAHTTLSQMGGVPDDVIASLRNDTPIADSKLEALRQFAIVINESRGWPTDAEIERFLKAGHTQQTVLEVILGTALKTLSNYTNHVAETDLDSAFAANVWSSPTVQAAE
ncbi:NAD(P)H-dependent oxidoreductase [uncultured Tateyamaria sp.]|uniref:NAD(P)H-dependent oxidoreductase n=1 Tax=uncultured Tateyamaria sp. TaxID=455651 RepID=UPI0026143449|nr:NAD(P)H-dependent oxidoreductase [uncultured Tateyamaria sp.]